MPSREDRGERSASSEDRHRTRRRRRDASSDSGEVERRRSNRRGDTTEDRVVREHGKYRERTRDSQDLDRTSRRRSHREGRSPDDPSLERDHDSSRRERRHRHRHRSRSRDGSRHRSRSPPTKKRRRSPSIPPSPPRRSRAPLPPQDESFRGETGIVGAEAAPEKQKPNFKPTGLLAKEANTVAGTTTVLKYHEPPEARKPPPKEQWRMYVFKKKDLLDTIYLHQRSVWLVGRDQKVTDLLLEHPSISKQHAVLQFRYITSTNEYGDKTSKVKPYLIDLESANGTKLNGKAVEASRFVEVVDGDVIAFGESEREYVLMLPPP